MTSMKRYKNRLLIVVFIISRSSQTNQNSSSVFNGIYYLLRTTSSSSFQDSTTTMYTPSSFIFGIVAWLGFVASALASIPAHVFRGDSRAPAAIHQAGGFHAKGYTNRAGPDGTLFQHVEGTLRHPSRDPYISTSRDIKEAHKKAGKHGYVYSISTSGITATFKDVAAEYAAAGKRYGHASEQEIAAYLTIPYSHIVACYEVRTGHKVNVRDDISGDDVAIDDGTPVDSGDADDTYLEEIILDWSKFNETDTAAPESADHGIPVPLAGRVAKPLRV